jgi:hypothetical protein
MAEIDRKCINQAAHNFVRTDYVYTRDPEGKAIDRVADGPLYTMLFCSACGYSFEILLRPALTTEIAGNTAASGPVTTVE